MKVVGCGSDIVGDDAMTEGLLLLSVVPESIFESVSGEVVLGSWALVGTKHRRIARALRQSIVAFETRVELAGVDNLLSWNALR